MEVGRVIVSKLSFLDASSVVRKCETPTVENMQTQATSSDFPIFAKVVVVVRCVLRAGFAASIAAGSRSVFGDDDQYVS